MSVLVLELGVDMAEESEEQKTSTTKWKCPECGQRLTLYIPPSTTPTCANPEKHAGKVVKMIPNTSR